MKSVTVLSCFLPLLAIASADMMTGGRRQYSPTKTDEEVVSAMRGINDYFALSNDLEPRSLVEIVSATAQVVRGVTYSFTIEITGSSNGNEICDVSVWSQSWLEDVNLRNQVRIVKCVEKETDQTDSAPADEGNSGSTEAQEAQHAFERLLNSRMFNIYYVRVKGQPEFTRQVVDGEDQFVFSNLQMASTTCTKAIATSYAEAAEAFEGCPVADDADVRSTCNATVVKKGDKYEVKTHQC